MKKYILCCLLSVVSRFVLAQNAIEYSISFPNAVHHEAEVTISAKDLPAGELIFRMSRSSPGRYATHEFGKNVYGVKATDDKGMVIPVSQIAGDVYRIEKHNGAVRISYTVFGNHVDGTYLAIDETHAHINAPAAFMWFPSLTGREIHIRFNDLEKYRWKVATQLKPLGQKDSYSARDLQYFMDSPIELSDYKTASWQVSDQGKNPQTIRLVSHGTADPQPVIDGYAKMVQRMTEEAARVFGEFPRFDFGTYTFLQDVNPDNSGDGMEHRNSTVITNSAFQIAGRESAMLNTFSHEFFHAWNVERIRPKSLEPFDFSHANMSSELWFAEGFTQYYAPLILRRAGLRTDEEYLANISGIVNGVLNAAGPARFPATHMSRYAVFVDAGVSVDKNNYLNTFTSYYTYGAFIALALDLRLRSEFNRTLDDYMKAVWAAHGRNEKPYTMKDLENVLAGITSADFAGGFFRSYIEGTERNDYKTLLSRAGLTLKKLNPGKATLGPVQLTLISYTGKNRLANPTLKGSPLYEAGIDIGDHLLAIGDVKLTGNVNITEIISGFKPGQTVKVLFERKGVEKTADLTFQEDPALTIVPDENATAQQLTFRKSWLNSTTTQK